MPTRQTNSSKLTVSVVKEIIKAHKKAPIPVQITYGDNAVTVMVTPCISKENKIRIIMAVVDGCFDGDSYQPYLRKELTQMAILEFCTDIKVNGNEEILYSLINETDFYQTVSSHIQSDLCEIENTINSTVSHRQNEILSSQKIRLDESIDALTKCAEQFITFAKTFDGLDVGELLKMISQLTNHETREPNREAIGNIVPFLGIQSEHMEETEE